MLSIAVDLLYAMTIFLSPEDAACQREPDDRRLNESAIIARYLAPSRADVLIPSIFLSSSSSHALPSPDPAMSLLRALFPNE